MTETPPVETTEQRHFRLRREEKALRIHQRKLARKDRERKVERQRRGGASDDTELVNLCRSLGIDFYACPHGQIMTTIPEKLEGRRAELFKEPALSFLKENFNVEIVRENSAERLHFTNPKKGDDMNLYSVLAEKTGQKRKLCKEVYEALVEATHEQLKAEGRMRLPELGIVRIKYNPAREKRKGTNPFTGEKNFTFKAKPASNKVKVSVAKALREYANEKIPVKKRK